MGIFSNKIVVLILAGIVVAGVVWFSFLRDRGNTPLLQTQDMTAGGAVDSDVVAILLELRSVSLSGTIFSDPAFASLQDFGSPIVQEPVGRSNPFAPLENRSVQNISTTSTPRTGR